MDIFTMIVGGVLAILLIGFLLRLSYTIIQNLINGRKFHHLLEQDFNKLRFSNMLAALGINKTAYIYQTRAGDIRQQMNGCEACVNTDECDEKLLKEAIDIDDIDFCANQSELSKIKLKQSEMIHDND